MAKDNGGVDLERRALLLLAAASLGGAFSVSSDAWSSESPEGGWNKGDVVHLLPMANHHSFLIKVSFAEPILVPPRLVVGDSSFEGKRSDSEGYFWQFMAVALDPDSAYELQLLRVDGSPLCDPWPLKTFPHPDAPAEKLRLLSFTCAGGNSDMVLPNSQPIFLPLEVRRRLLQRALSFQPDVAVANGDHVYWDINTVNFMKNAVVRETIKSFMASFGEFQRDLPILGTSNEEVLKRVVDPQIADLYGVSFRSVPTYFLSDDHDLFDNDDAEKDYISFPPDTFMKRAARATQRLYYPEFLIDKNMPSGLPGCFASDYGVNVSGNFGAIRYGRLFEGLLYDCRRFMTLKDQVATFVPDDVESWLSRRTGSSDVSQLMHIPSTPFGWTAGKWGEWYPDVLNDEGQLTIDSPKYMWQQGWWSQHQRLLKMLHDQKSRSAISLSGDLHATGWTQILKSGDLDLSDNPVYSILSGTPGTAGPGWPSSFRGTGSMTPVQLEVGEGMAPIEKNGFTVLDITAREIMVKQFAWLPDQPLEHIDTMEPVEEFVIARV